MGIAMKATTILNSLLVKTSENAANKKGITGREYLIKSLWETNKVEAKNSPTYQIKIPVFCFMSLESPKVTKR